MGLSSWVFSDFVSVFSEFNLQTCSVLIHSLFLTWVLEESVKRLCFQRSSSEPKPKNRGQQRSLILKLAICSNFLIASFYLCNSIWEISKLKTISPESIFPAITWVAISGFTITTHQKLPLLLRFWWVFSVGYIIFSVILRLKPGLLSWFSPPSTFSDISSLPFSIFLCFIAFTRPVQEELTGTKEPLLSPENESPTLSCYSDAGIFSRLTFRWLNPLFELGRIQNLELHHVPSLPPTHSAENSFFSLQQAFQKQRKNQISSLPKTIFSSISNSLALNSIFAGINTLSSYTGPFLITGFVDFLAGKHENSGHGYGYLLALALFFFKTLESLSQRQWYFGAQKIGIKVRAALMVSIYRRSLLNSNKKIKNSGEIVNFLSVDVERIGDFFWYIHGIWLLPVQVSLALLILYRNLGFAASIAAFFSTIFIMVINTPLANLQEKLHSKIMDAKDSRIKSTSEILKNMRILKLHSWESIYLNKILQLRETERHSLKSYLYLSSAVCFLFWASPTLVSVVTFGVCILVKTPLTSGKVLSALATFRILQEPIYNLPELISMIAQTKVSIDRIQDFVREDVNYQKTKETHIGNSDFAVEIGEGEFSRDSTLFSNKPMIIKIAKKINIKKGEKVAICGSVGSGKSSFLCSIIGEIPRIWGCGSKAFGSKGYVPQSAWIQTGTIRENVLFGREMDEKFYESVIEACNLNRDLEMLVNGDLTVIGERGMNLSGGQKQRIQMARAIYSDADVYLLDDPFSAVDAHTGAHLFKECIMGLLAHKTVIYVTHQLEFLDASDLVLVMKEGKLVQSGKYKELITDKNGELANLMIAHNQSLSQVNQTEASVTPLFQEQRFSKFDQKNQIAELEEENNKDNKLQDIYQEEERESGRVKFKVYSTFITAAYKGALVPVILLCQVLFQGLQMGSNYWIAWATDNEGSISRKTMMAVYVMLSLGSSVCVLGRAVLLATTAMKTAQRLFECMLTCIFRAPISFFDSTPSSRILNRSSTDQSIVDTDIPYRLAGLAFALIQLIGIIIIMSQVAWQIFLLFLLVLAISIWYQNYYIATARQLARMVGIRKAPILHHFSESIAGAATIRCFNQELRFFTKNLSLIDDYSCLSFHNSATMEWLCLRINFLFNLVFFFVLITLVMMPRAAMDPGLAGLAATYGLNLNVLQAWVIWNLCNVENKMISVERILQFSNIPCEAPLVIENCRPEQSWPQCGTVELYNLHVRYSPQLPLVLRGISCRFPGEKKIGVVGRTGSGKSTLIQALFRVVEPEEGTILIDGVDICKMGLQDLRSRLSIIPQEPALFQGTLKTNIDPLHQHSDAEIWEVLDKCQLREIVRKDQRLLDAPVSEDGENWSVGQRQLVSLSRVLLKKRRILVLDEATASVDTATDNLIQRTIRAETSNCTVITVAHRIPTVIDNDLVLVLNEGKVAEYDSPAQLLKDRSSEFSKLVMEFLRRSKRDYHSPTF